MRGVPSRRLPAPNWALGEPPMPLTRDLPPASPFPEEAMGAIGAEVVALMHRIIQAPSALVGQSIKPELRLAQELLQWWRLKVGPGRVITLTDIYRNGPAAIRSAAVARAVVRTLLDHGWLVPGEHPRSKEAFEMLEPR